MRSFPKDADDKKELKKLNAEPWMVNLLKMNPSYVYWGPGEDYMSTGEGHGWDRAIIDPTWKESGFKGLDDYNEVVHFYFDVHRNHEECPACKGDGYNPKTSQLSNDFYNHSSSTGQGWGSNITEDEVDALLKSNRLSDLTHGMPIGYRPTAQEVNDWNNHTGKFAGKRGFLGHDGINRWILIETRAKRLGFWGKCPTCKGDGYVFTAPKAHVKLILWVLHPRKGAARGVEISKVDKTDLPEIFDFLKKAHERNTVRFSKLDLSKV